MAINTQQNVVKYQISYFYGNKRKYTILRQIIKISDFCIYMDFLMDFMEGV